MKEEPINTEYICPQNIKYAFLLMEKWKDRAKVTAGNECYSGYKRKGLKV